MRCPFVVLPLLVVSILPATAQEWTPIDLGTTVTLRAFQQSGNGRYLVGDGGSVWLSDLSYTVWTPEDVGTAADLRSVVRLFFGGTIWAGGRGGVVRMRDGTGVWHVRDIPDPTQDYVVVEQIDVDGVVLAGGSGGSIWKSTDLGLNWTIQDSGVTTSLHGGAGTFATTTRDYFVGNDGLILRSTSGGSAWMPLPSGTTEDLFAIEVIPSNGSGFVAAGANGTILITSDGGATWAPRVSGTTETLRALSRSGPGDFLAAGDGGTLLRSFNSGATWCVIGTSVNTNFFAAMMLSPTHYLVAGENGVLLRTETGGGGCVTVANEPEAAVGYALSAVWPNPAHDEATLTLRVERPQRVTAEVFDLGGRRVAEVFAREVAARIVVPITLDVQAMAPGAYLVRVRGSAFEESRSMVVVR